MNTASIVSNNLPIGSSADYYLGSVWLMFASGTYFRSENQPVYPPYDLNASVLVNPNLSARRVGNSRVAPAPCRSGSLMWIPRGFGKPTPFMRLPASRTSAIFRWPAASSLIN